MSNFTNYLKSKKLDTLLTAQLNENLKISKGTAKYKKIFEKFKNDYQAIKTLIMTTKAKVYDNPNDLNEIVTQFEENINRFIDILGTIQKYEEESVAPGKLSKPDTVQPQTKEELKRIINRTTFDNGLKCDLNFIDTSKITDMSHLFESSRFNGDISKWDVSKVENMDSMFNDSEFNGDISKWNVSHVKDMSWMFRNSKFNGDISKWNVSNVKDMNNMFRESQFDRDISKWDVSHVEDMSAMFYDSKFYGDISKWDVSNVRNMNEMFYRSIFDGDISNWDVSNVETMEDMFTRSEFDDIRILSKWSPQKGANRHNVFNNSPLDGMRFKHLK